MTRSAIMISLWVVLALLRMVWAVPNSGAADDSQNMVPCLSDDSTPTAPGPLPIDVRPPGREEAQVIPASDDPNSTDGTFGRELYLAVFTIPPGECVPFEVTGNQRDGAVIWLVQQGVVEFTWEPFPDTSPVVEVGDNVRTEQLPLPNGQPRLLYPGNWVSQDRQIKVSYTNVGGESAIVLKAVFAKPALGGCHGGCK
jgi:hypothetical protein